MDDLIRRAELLADIERDIENSGCVNHEREIMDCVRYAQTVDAEIVRHARWIERKVSDDHYQYICSNCNDYHGIKGIGFSMAREMRENYLYCRKCGCRMDAKEGRNGKER